jgi:putative ABC transport system permease protein
MIAISISLMLSLQGLYDGMAENMIDKNKRSESGDVSLYAKGYRLTKDIKNTIKDAHKIKKELSKLDSVKAVVLKVKADGLASTARKSSFATLHGINLDEEESFSRFSEFVKEGRLDFEKRGVAIGIELAKTLKVKIGSKVIFSTQDIDGEINSLALKVKAIVQTTNIVQDKTAIFLDKKTLYDFLSLDAHSAMQIAILSDDENLADILKQKYPHLEVKTFLELQPTMKMMQDVMVVFNSITFFIVMGVVFVGIFGVLYVSVLSRIREFGIMLSIGMHYRYMKYQILLEAIFIGLIGYIAGAILGAMMLLYLREYGLDFSSFSDALQMWGYESVIYGTIKLSYFSTTLVAILGASVLSVWLPLRRLKNDRVKKCK